VWHLLANRECRHAVMIAERFAEGDAVPSELDDAAAAVRATIQRALPGILYTDERKQAAFDVAALAVEQFLRYAEGARLARVVAAEEEVAAFQADAIRCIFGPSPFRQPLPIIDASVLAWNGGTVVSLAQAIYDDRRFDDLPVLADAMEEA